MGPLYLFVNCAGMAICGRLEDNSSGDIMVFTIVLLLWFYLILLNIMIAND